MKNIQKALFLAVMGAGLMAPVQAEEVHMIMCGGEIREADQVVISAFEAKYSGVTVNAEAVPWGTCQDKSMTLAAAGDPVGLAYMGSRTLKQLARSGLIVPVNISDEQQGMYQPGILNTVSDGGKTWGFPHAFSTKALFINCGLVEEAGMACVAPKTWTGMYNMAKAINDNTSAAGVGVTGKDFDNTMHQFLNYLYSNGGSVNDRFDASTAVRARQPPCSPTWVTLPQITSSTAWPSRLLRLLRSFKTPADRRAEVTSCRLPSGRPLPRGVRIASKI